MYLGGGFMDGRGGGGVCAGAGPAHQGPAAMSATETGQRRLIGTLGGENAHQFVMLVTLTQTDIAYFPP
jgi:hypothetical protein